MGILAGVQITPAVRKTVYSHGFLAYRRYIDEIVERDMLHRIKDLILDAFFFVIIPLVVLFVIGITLHGAWQVVHAPLEDNGGRGPQDAVTPQ